MEFRVLKSSTLPWITCGLFGTFFLGSLLICVFGTRYQHTGWIAIDSPISTETQPTNGGLRDYSGRLKHKNPLLRGNDLFIVQDPEIQESQSVRAAVWDSTNGRGRVRLTLLAAAAMDPPLTVRYRLGVRWKKLLPVFCVLLALTLVLCLYFKMKDKPEIIHQRRLMIATQAILCFILASYAYWNSSLAGWLYGDEHFILSSTVQGALLPWTVFPEAGRFFPLGLVDLNLLIPFGDNPFAYTLERVLLLVAVTGLVFCLTTRAAGTTIGSLLTIAFLLTPDLSKIYSNAIFPESLLLLMLGLFFLLYYLADDRKRDRLLWLSCLVASFATYCKEPVFGLFVVFSLTQLGFGYHQLTRSQRWANLYLLFNAVVFLIVYWSFCSNGGNYAEIRNDGTISTVGLLLNYLAQPMLALGMLTALWRLFAIVHYRDRQSLKYDGALFAGVAYMGAYAILKLQGDYYLIPAYLCLTCAFSGYLNGIQKQIAVNKSSVQGTIAKTPDAIPRRLMVPLLSMLLVFAALNIPGSIHGFVTNLDGRKETQQLSNLFSKLEKQGFEMYTYTPPSMSDHSRKVQEWRRLVLNVFDFNTKRQTNIENIWDHRPVRELTTPGNAPIPRHPIVIHDQAYSIEPLNRKQPVADRLELVELTPHVMGAHIFAKPEDHTAIKEAAGIHQSRLY